jgi:cysteine synthase A
VRSSPLTGIRQRPRETFMHKTTEAWAIPEQRLRALHRLVGNTPLLSIDLTWRGRLRTIYAKCEYLNMTGSIKDRMALRILESAYRSGALRPGATIAEATSGNTGISFAGIGRALGHPVVIFMPDWMSRERRDLIASFGARVELVSREDGGFLGSIARAEALAVARPDVFLPRQFSNPANVEAHTTGTGPEIWWQFASAARLPDAFVAGVGTGGTVMGVGGFLKERWRHIQVHPVEPAESPTLSTGHKVGKHRIQGISDEFIPEIVKLDRLDAVLGVHDGDAILMAQKLASDLGLGVGISSGANFVAALMAQDRLGPDALVVTVFPDSNKKYLSTDLLKTEPVRPDYIAPEVELVSMDAIHRVCAMCADLAD